MKQLPGPQMQMHLIQASLKEEFMLTHVDMLLLLLKVVISLFLSLPIMLITCYNSLTYQESAQNSRTVDRMLSIYQKYLSNPGPKRQRVGLHRPTQMEAKLTTAQSNYWKAHKRGTIHNCTNLPTAILHVTREREIQVPNSFQQHPKDRLLSSLVPCQEVTICGWHDYYFSPSLNSRKGTAHFLRQVRKNNIGLLFRTQTFGSFERWLHPSPFQCEN